VCESGIASSRPLRPVKSAKISSIALLVWCLAVGSKIVAVAIVNARCLAAGLSSPGGDGALWLLYG